MNATTLRLYSLDYRGSKTYLYAALFVAGNLVLPQLCHLVPGGGKILLPIYFFTLVGTYKYGWKVGLLTALLSPLANSLLFGMPSLAVLPVIVFKSTLLVAGAGLAAHYFRRISIPILAGVVMACQIAGTLGEWAITGSFYVATQDLRMALPGMLLQIFGGYAFLKYLLKK